MTEIRIDPFSVREIITSTRTMRNNVKDFTAPRFAKKEGPCAFCSGQEKETLPEIFAIREDNTSRDDVGWKVRVIPHKWGVLYPDYFYNNNVKESCKGMLGIGRHEIIVESPLHIVHIRDLKLKRITEILKVYQMRMKDIYKDDVIKYVSIFKNQEEAACISMFHAHSQIIGLPFIPQNIKKEYSISKDYYAAKKSCIYCNEINNKDSQKERLIELTDNFISFVPFAPRFLFETHIYPKKHSADFSSQSPEEFHELATILKSSIMKICMLFDDPPLNYCIHSAPPNAHEKNYHWHIEIYPHPLGVGGFEWASGSFINPALPEEAAMLLRNTDVRLLFDEEDGN